jgi:hypothetical protein
MCIRKAILSQIKEAITGVVALSLNNENHPLQKTKMGSMCAPRNTCRNSLNLVSNQGFKQSEVVQGTAKSAVGLGLEDVVAEKRCCCQCS